MTMRDIMQTIFAALVIVIGAYVHVLVSGAEYVWRWMFN